MDVNVIDQEETSLSLSHKILYILRGVGGLKY